MTISTADFLDVVIPQGNRYIGFTDGRLGAHGRPIIMCSAFEGGTQGAAIGQRRSEKGDVYFALASFKEAKIYDAEKGYMKSHRHQSNVAKLKTIWLDVDFKNYATPKDCVAGVEAFLRNDIPMPTFIVNSGGGLHLYWVFEEELDPSRWLPLAQGLAALAKQLGLLADYGVTIDSARVLRLPGTPNRKYDHLPMCEVKHMGSYAHIERMEQLLLPHAAGQAGAPAPITADSNVVNLFDPAANKTDLASGYQAGLTSRFSEIVKECPTLAESLETAGATDSYIRWKDTLHILAFTEDGEDYVSRVSDGHPSYSEQDAMARFGESVSAKLANRRGPTTCQRFSAYSSKCATCKHIGRITSPWSLGVTKEENTRPPSYVLKGETFTEAWVPNENGDLEVKRVKVVSAALDNWRLIPTTDPKEPYELWFDVVKGKNSRTAKLTTGECVEVNRLRAALFNYGLGLGASEIKKMQELVMAWTTQLASMRPAEETKGFGWSTDRRSFVLGARKITTVSEEPVLNRDFEGDDYGIQGRLTPWTTLASRLVQDDDPSFQYLICAGFAGPLMGILHQRTSLAVSAYSHHSGAGKSTILKTIQSAFGKPSKMFMMDDTANAITHRIGLTQGLPALWDEVRGHDTARTVTEVLFRLMQNKTKQRLTSNIKLAATYDLATMLIAASNQPLADFIAQKVRQTNAGMARFLEFEMVVKRDTDEEISGLETQLATNYGHAGPIFLRFVMQHYDALAAAEKGFLDMLDKKRKWPSEERFWKWGTAKILLAGYILLKTGLAPIDMAKLLRFALAAVEMQRSVMDEQEVEDFDAVSDIVQHFMDDVLVTDEYGVQGRGAVITKLAPRGHRVAVHISVKGMKVRIAKSAIREYAELNQLSQKNLLNQLKASHNAQTTKVCLGSGTQYGQPQAYVLELELEKAVGEGMIATWMEKAP